MKKLTIALLTAWLALAWGYFLWSTSGKMLPYQEPQLFLEEVRSLGSDMGRGNMLGVQPYMLPYDYASRETFLRKTEAYLAEAKERGLLNDKSVVVFPEYYGTWLVALNEKGSVYKAATAEQALSRVVLTNLLSFGNEYLKAPASVGDKVKYSLFVSKAKKMASVYHSVFSELARRYRVSIVAGSILLPEPYVVNDSLHTGRGTLQNVSVVYYPDGKPEPNLVRKVFPVNDEKPFVGGCKLEDIPVFDLPAGRTAVLICADSWYPESYRHLKRLKVNLVAVPSYLAGDLAMLQRWRGYNGGPFPHDVSKADTLRLTEGAAWERHALAGRIGESGAELGLNVFLRGQLWDLGSDGYIIVATPDGITRGTHQNGASLVNVWVGSEVLP